jgi:hypothetical protein
VGCSKSSRDEEIEEEASDMVTMKKWLVDVRCQGCRGLFYRSAPGMIVPDADWPRNGDVVVGYEIPNVPGTSCFLDSHHLH